MSNNLISQIGVLESILHGFQTSKHMLGKKKKKKGNRTNYCLNQQQQKQI